MQVNEITWHKRGVPYAGLVCLEVNDKMQSPEAIGKVYAEAGFDVLPVRADRWRRTIDRAAADMAERIWHGAASGRPRPAVVMDGGALAVAAHLAARYAGIVDAPTHLLLRENLSERQWRGLLELNDRLCAGRSLDEDRRYRAKARRALLVNEKARLEAFEATASFRFPLEGVFATTTWCPGIASRNMRDGFLRAHVRLGGMAACDKGGIDVVSLAERVRRQPPLPVTA